jgi:hypothetical protein
MGQQLSSFGENRHTGHAVPVAIAALAVDKVSLEVRQHFRIARCQKNAVAA